MYLSDTNHAWVWFDRSVDSNGWSRSERFVSLRLGSCLVSSPSLKGRGGRPHNLPRRILDCCHLELINPSIQLANLILVACPIVTLHAAAAGCYTPWGWQVPVCYWLWGSRMLGEENLAGDSSVMGRTFHLWLLWFGIFPYASGFCASESQTKPFRRKSSVFRRKIFRLLSAVRLSAVEAVAQPESNVGVERLWSSDIWGGVLE